MDRDINAPFMLPVSEKYVELGTMVMGKIESGRVKKGDALLLMPNKVRVGCSDFSTIHPQSLWALRQLFTIRPVSSVPNLTLLC
jgi:peptide chain release factor subunit 3